MTDNAKPAVSSTVQGEVRNDNRPRCSVRGLVRRGVLCGGVRVGGEFCGSDRECPHKVIPNAAPHLRGGASAEPRKSGGACSP
jgi:hypothetical protein